MKNSYKFILSSRPAIEYVQACELVSDFYKDKEDLPKEIKKIYISALENYREFLRKRGVFMPLPPYPYDSHNKSTWKYLDTIIYELQGKRQYITMKNNPNWIGLKKNKI